MFSESDCSSLASICSCSCLRFSSLVILLNARHSNHLEVILRRAACSLAHSAICFSFSFLENIIQAWFSIYPLVSFRKSCTSDQEPFSPSPVLRKSDTLRMSPCIIDNMFRNIGDTRVSQCYPVNAFQWDLECSKNPVRVVGRIVRQRLTCVTVATRESRPWFHSILSKAPTDVPTRRPRIRIRSRSCGLTIPRPPSQQGKPTLVAFRTSRPKNDTLIVISIGSDIARVKDLVRLVSRVATPVLAESTRFVPSHFIFSSAFPRSLQSPFPNGSTGKCKGASSTQLVVGNPKLHSRRETNERELYEWVSFPMPFVAVDHPVDGQKTCRKVENVVNAVLRTAACSAIGTNAKNIADTLIHPVPSATQLAVSPLRTT